MPYPKPGQQCPVCEQVMPVHDVVRDVLHAARDNPYLGPEFVDALEMEFARLAATAREDVTRLAAARRIVDEQAKDEGLWFNARTAPEAYLQQELRRLHAAVEAEAAAPSEASTSLEEALQHMFHDMSDPECRHTADGTMMGCRDEARDGARHPAMRPFATAREDVKRLTAALRVMTHAHYYDRHSSGRNGCEPCAKVRDLLAEVSPEDES